MEGKRHPSKSQRDQHLHEPRGATPESEALHRAAAHCQAAFAYCTTVANEVDDLEDLLCLVDCAELCLATAGFVVRDAHYATELRMLCAQQLQDILEVLADYPQDAVMQACADALREAEDSLQQSVQSSAE
jgi:hypothetical protein